MSKTLILEKMNLRLRGLRGTSKFAQQVVDKGQALTLSIPKPQYSVPSIACSSGLISQAFLGQEQF